MQIQSVLALTVLFAGAMPALASDLACPGLTPRPFSRIETKIDWDGTILEGKAVTCKKVGVGAKVVTDIQRMLGRDLATPNTIIFRMVDTFDNAFFMPGEISLNVPWQFVIEGYAKHPNQVIPIWAHEYGHAVLDHVLTNAASKWRAYIRKRVAPSEDPKVDPAEVLEYLIQPYHEFFADVIAVLYTEKPDAVAKSMFMVGYMTNPEGKPSNCSNRDKACRPRNEPEKWRAFATNRDFTERKNQLGTWRGVPVEQYHNLLAPSRYHIYKYYLSNPEIKRQKGRLAKLTVDAVLEDLNVRLQRIAAAPGGFTEKNVHREVADVQRTNKDFIETIDSVFGKAVR